MATDVQMSGEDGAAIAGRIREALARRRISRQRLADDARISISTLEKVLSGRRPFTLATTIRLEEALGARLRDSAHSPQPVAAAMAGHAPETLGAYSRQAVVWLEGQYLTIRPSFEQKGVVYTYRIDITWDEGASCLTFQEAARLDVEFIQKGTVSLSNKSGHIYLMTNDEGQIRLMVLGRPMISGEMSGLLTTLKSSGSQLMPATCPIVLAPLRRVGEPRFGIVRPGEPDHETYSGLLTRAVEQSFVRFYID